MMKTTEYIQSDLLHAKEVIKITTLPESKKIEFIKNLEKKFQEFEDNSELTLQQQLFFLAIIINLFIYYYQIKNTQKENYCFGKLSECLDQLQANTHLKDMYKPNWYMSIGSAFSITEYYGDAIDAYEKALELEKKQNSKNNSVILEYVVMLIELNLKRQLYFRKKDPAPSLVRKYYSAVLEWSAVALALSNNHLISKIYYFQAQANSILAGLNYEQADAKSAFEQYLKAMSNDILAIKNTNSSKNQKKFLDHIAMCIKKINSITLDIANHLNTKDLEFYLKRLNGLIINYDQNKLEQLEKLVEKIHDLLLQPLGTKTILKNQFYQTTAHVNEENDANFWLRK